MAKLFIVAISLLVVSAVSAMPVADEERKEQPSLVVPLEKIAEKEKPLEKPIEEIKSEPTQPTQQLSQAEEKKTIQEEPILKKVEDEKKNVESIKEEKKSELEIPKIEEKKAEEPKIKETKVELLAQPEIPEKHQDDAPITEAPIEKKVEEVKKPQENLEPLTKETPIPVAEVQPIPTAAAIAEPAPEANNLKDQRTLRGTEDVKPIEKKEELPAAIPLPVEDKKLQQPTEEPKLQVKALNSEATKAEILEEPKKETATLKEEKPLEIATAAAIIEPTKPADEPPAPQIKQAAKPVQLLSSSPVQETHENIKEQRSEDSVPVDESKVAPVIPKQEVVVEKVAPVQPIEKVAKSVDEPKAEELPKPQEVKESKIELPKIAETEPILKKEEKLVEEKPLADMASKEELKKEEKKKDSSEEVSSEEKLTEKKMEKKDSSEEKESSEEAIETKKKLDEKKEEISKVAELTTLIPATS